MDRTTAWINSTKIGASSTENLLDFGMSRHTIRFMNSSPVRRIAPLLLVSLFAISSLFAGDNVVITTPILESHFYRPIKQPLFVKYALFKGGGSCDRGSTDFKNDQAGLETATDKDYAGSGYDKGHLANAEDFANNCAKQKLTFVYYNALPQTVNLNRGVWKSNETTIRQWSQKDRLVIICGGYKFRKKGRLYVPTNCFKVVQKKATGKILFCGTYTNTSKAKKKDITEAALEKTLGYKLPILKIPASGNN